MWHMFWGGGKTDTTLLFLGGRRGLAMGAKGVQEGETVSLEDLGRQAADKGGASIAQVILCPGLPPGSTGSRLLLSSSLGFHVIDQRE